jgi:outer membrane immunogenic protein
MKNKYLLTTAVIALSAAASLASAQGLLAGDDLWTGGFVGVGASASDMSGDLTFDGFTEGTSSTPNIGWFNTGGSTGGDASAIGSGGFGTIEVGADKQLGPQWVVGGFASYNFGGTDASATFDDEWVSGNICEGFVAPCPASVTGTVAMGDNWTIGGRVGYLVNSNTLVYGLAGYSSAKMSVSVNNTLDDFFGVGSDLTVGDSSEELDVNGTTFGAGVEYLLTNSWSIKMEYQNTVYDGSALSGGVGLSNFSEGTDYSGTFDGSATNLGDIAVQSVRAVVAYRF